MATTSGERRLVGEDLLCKPLVQLALHRLVTLRPGRTGAKASDDYSGRVQDSREAIVYMAESFGQDSEGAEWAQGLEVGDFEDLVKRFARPEPAR